MPRLLRCGVKRCGDRREGALGDVRDADLATAAVPLAAATAVILVGLRESPFV